MIKPIAAGVMLAAVAAAALSQQRAEESIFSVRQLTPQISVLFGKSAGTTALSNVTIFASDDGVLVVDDQFYRMRRDGRTVDIADGIVEQIRKITDRPIRYVVNTHHHGDHSGGNAVFGKLATIVAQANVRTDLIEGQDALLARSPGQIARLEQDLAGAGTAADRGRRERLEEQLANARLQLEMARSVDFQRTLPAITYDQELQLYLGGEEIRFYHFGPAHTNGDSLVYFTKANVAAWGDVFQLNSHPAINPAAGGSTGNWIAFIEKGLKVVRPDATMIPGHGGTSRITDVGTAADVRAMQTYLIDVRAAIGREIQAGRTRDETVERVVPQFPQYKDFRPDEARFRGSIGAIFDEMRKEPAAGDRPGAR